MEITKPTLMVDEAICRRNIREMMEKAHNSGVVLRPHFKTHQSREVGEWFREEGLKAITVSSATMASYFADCGWKDITIAFPYNPREWKVINELASRVKLNVIIVSREALDHLKSTVLNPLHYWIKIDVGTHRTGILPEKRELIQEISKAAGQHQFEGLLAHAGHSYTQLNREKAKAIFESTVKILSDLKSQTGALTKLSYGDTPSCSMLDSFEGVNELRPGNFVFYDTMQESFGVCDLSQIAVCMACPVVAIHEDRNELLIYGGAVHFSKDFIPNEATKYGVVVKFNGGWKPQPIGGLIKTSQEHGIVKLHDPTMPIKIGDLLGVLPVHSCLTADLQGYYLSLTGQKLTKLQRPL